MASTAITTTLRSLEPQYKTEYPSEISEDSCQSSSASMVETSLPAQIKEEESVSPRLASASPNYLSTAMLLSTQNCAYFGQRLSNLNLDRRTEKQSENSHQLFHQQKQSVPTSLFTIDSILASKPSSQSGSPSSSPTHESQKSGSTNNSNQPSPIRPTRVSTMLHPGLHLSHLAAAANFGAPSDFLGNV